MSLGGYSRTMKEYLSSLVGAASLRKGLVKTNRSEGVLDKKSQKLEFI